MRSIINLPFKIQIKGKTYNVRRIPPKGSPLEDFEFTMKAEDGGLYHVTPASCTCPDRKFKEATAARFEVPAKSCKHMNKAAEIKQRVNDQYVEDQIFFVWRNLEPQEVS